jgi:hypothetical protein
MLFCLSFTVTSFQTIVLKSFPSLERRESECKSPKLPNIHYITYLSSTYAISKPNITGTFKNIYRLTSYYI